MLQLLVALAAAVTPAYAQQPRPGPGTLVPVMIGILVLFIVVGLLMKKILRLNRPPTVLPTTAAAATTTVTAGHVTPAPAYAPPTPPPVPPPPYSVIPEAR
ncbi:hypothetical protein Q8F55_000554 [Vanrija albida]|uniref:Uncharacterized protein n=1 Tax=Vanrija albida TaxID=181172 RepID=A0ABR3QDL2_9TREE